MSSNLTRRARNAQKASDNNDSDQEMQDVAATGNGDTMGAGDAAVKGQTSLHKFFGGKPKDEESALMMQQQVNHGPGGRGNQKDKKQFIFKAKRHPLSLLKDGVSTVRYLPDGNHSIFTIVMPWRQEQEEEEKKKQNKLKAHQNQIKQQSLKAWVKLKAGEPTDAEQRLAQARVISKEEEKYQQQLWDGELDESSEEYNRLQKVVKVKEVQKVRLQDYTQNVQAILINPKWRECDHFKEFIKSQGTQETTAPKTDSQGRASDADGDSDIEDNQHQSKAFKGISMEEFEKLVIPKSVMQDGILFIWVEKEYIMDVCIFLEKQEFYYVENMCWVMLDESMREEVDKTRTQDATPAFVREDYTYLKKSKKTLLMFRRISKSDGDQGTAKLELRHQRTGDVVFDWIDPVNRFSKPQYYTYKLIETLLPKAMVDLKKSPHLKMIELWAQDDKPRKGWIKFLGLNQ